MAAKKNKKAKKPAVGNPAAGSNNKREKNKSLPPQNVKAKNADGKNSAQKNQLKPQKSAPEKADAVKDKAARKSVAEKALKKEKAKNKIKKSNPEHKKEETVIQKIIETEQSTAAQFENFKKEYNMRKVAAALAIVVVIVAAIIILLVKLFSGNIAVPDYVKNMEYKGRVEPESVAFSMDLSENQQKALVKATKRKGDKHSFDFFVNDNIIMNECDEPALLEFGSVKSNDCVLLFFLFDENGNEIYRSLGIEPGKQVKSISLFDEMSYGSHDATLAVVGYDKETNKKTGMQTAKIKLEIGVE